MTIITISSTLNIMAIVSFLIIYVQRKRPYTAIYWYVLEGATSSSGLRGEALCAWGEEQQQGAFSHFWCWCWCWWWWQWWWWWWWWCCLCWDRFSNQLEKFASGGTHVCWEIWSDNWEVGDGEGNAQKKVKTTTTTTITKTTTTSTTKSNNNKKQQQQNSNNNKTTPITMAKTKKRTITMANENSNNKNGKWEMVKEMHRKGK